jgi:putative Ca2+/H+ antiporter (TMEM165/GDT1 family)
MDWKVFASAFGMLFLAEMGDKTQLAVLTLSAESKKPASVFLGAVLALAVVTLIGVAVGEAVSRFIPATYLHRAAAVLFVGMGIWMWFSKG